MRFEYTTTYVKVNYDSDKPTKKGFGGLFRKTPKPPKLPTNPDPESVLGNEDYQAALSKMGNAGWELVGVQPLLRGAHEVQNPLWYGGAGVAFAVTAGYYLFWKRALDDAQGAGSIFSNAHAADNDLRI